MIKLFGMMLSTTENLYEEEIWSQLSDYVTSPDERILFFCGRPLESTFEDEAFSNVIYNLMKMIRLEGVISLTGSLNYYVGSKVYKEYLNSIANAPIVSLSIPIDGANLVQCDNFMGSYEITKHLINHQYRKFGIINGPSYSSESNARFRGIEQAFNEHNIHEYVLLEGDYSKKSGYLNAVELLTQNVEAIICGNDQMAIGAIKAINEAGKKIPDDIAIVGFDDIEQVRLLEVPLTTVKQPFGNMACKAFDLLKEDNKSDQCIPAELIIRESCGCPKAFNSIEHEEHDKRYYMQKYAESLSEYTLMLQLRSSFDQVQTLDHLFEVIDEYLMKIKGVQLHLCLFDESSQIIDKPLKYEWPSKINYAYGSINGCLMPVQVFPTRNGLPSEVIKQSNSKSYLFYPIHQHDILYGYLVIDAITARNRIFTSLKREITNTLSRLDLMVKIQSYTKQLEKIAQTDILTGILNRRGFFEYASKKFEYDLSIGNTPGIVFCDVNGLKKVNDHFGHEFGDRMISDTGLILSQVFKNYVLARMGGDEFVVYISHCSQSYLDDLGHELIEKIHQFNGHSIAVYQISLEAGMAYYDPKKHASLEELITEADQNLYTKKRFRVIK
ncbi:MAG: GGDEF domain-containing protein [Erysipelothrix sp.]|nr:GGDEF domain-containing protein [Erysipelothrix sp.]